MFNLDKNQKTAIVIFIISAIIMTLVSIYLVVNKTDTYIKNNKIYVINTNAFSDPTFDEEYNKRKDNIGAFDMNQYDPPLDSSNINVTDWNKIAKDIGTQYNNYNSFIIITGSETLPYTASALAFMLENNYKPIILTNDNLISALVIASVTSIPEVMVLSNGELLRGCRTIAPSTSEFASPNYPKLTTQTCLALPTEDSTKVLFMNPTIRIVVVKVFPGMDDKYLKGMTRNSFVHAIVLETFGRGKSPISEKILQEISGLTKNGVIIVNVSQCNKMDKDFDTDLRLLEAGVLSGYDMTTAAAFAKLHFLIGNVTDKKLIAQLIETNYKGEQSTM